jgi:hypothetical protein
MFLRIAANITTGIGLAISILGVILYYQLEQQSFETTHDREFRFLTIVWFPTLALGTSVAIIGTVLWGWILPAARRLRLAATLFGLSFPVFILAILGVHNWVASFLWIGLGLLGASVLLVGQALIMRLARKRTVDPE